MDPLVTEELRGNWAPVLTEHHAQALLDFEVDGLVADGTAAPVVAGLCEDAGVPFLLDTGESIEEALAYEPGALRVEVSDARMLGPIRAAAGPVGIVWRLRAEQQRAFDPKNLRTLVELGLLGIDLAELDEAWLEAARPFEEVLSVFVPGPWLATGYRLGAHGSVSCLACLHPGTAQAFADALETDIEEALALERRVQRFLEVHLDRRKYPDLEATLCALGEWCESGVRVDERLREIARAELPEFFALRG
ncbi:MAG: hypothetical protein GY711_17630 [bacterium]|nr:hypothetical protein [bacterium]